MVRKKPMDPPWPEPMLHPLRPDDSEEDLSEEELIAKQSQETVETSIPRSAAEKARRKAVQQAKVRVTFDSSFEVRDVCKLQ